MNNGNGHADFDGWGWIKKVSTYILLGLFGMTLFGYCTDDYKPDTNHRQHFKGTIPGKSAKDIKHIDYSTGTVYYRPYKDPNSNQISQRKVTVMPHPTTRKKTRVEIKDNEMIISVPIDKERMVYEMMDDMDYNDLLDYYGSPELQ